MTSYVPPIKNGASGWIGYVSLAPRTATGAWQSNPTLATGDVKISIDGGSLANLGTLPAVTPASSKLVKITLSQAETNGDNLTIIFSDAAGAEWCDLTINLQTVARQIDDLAYPATSGRSITVDASGNANANLVNIAGSAVSTSSAQIGVNVVNAGGTAWASGSITAGVIAADAIGASELAADAIAEIADAVWDEDATGHQTQGTFGQAIGDPGADSDTIWGIVNAIGATGTGLSAIPWNASWDAEVQSEVDDALVAQNLDHLVKIAVDTNFATTVHADSVIGQIADNGAGFDRTTDSLEAIRDRGDAAWVTATGFSTHSAADVWSVATRSLTVLDEDSTTLDLDSTIRSAVGLASANLDTQLTDIDNYLDTEVAAIKAKTDNLPASPAATGDAMTLTSAYDFAKGTVAMTEAYAANGAAPTPVQAFYAIHQMLMQFSIASTTITVKKLDNSTTAFSVTLNDATTPTSAVRT